MLLTPVSPIHFLTQSLWWYLILFHDMHFMSQPNLLLYFLHLIMYICKLFLYCSVWSVMPLYIGRFPMDLMNQAYSLYNIEYTNKWLEYKECVKSLHLGHEEISSMWWIIPDIYFAEIFYDGPLSDIKYIVPYFQMWNIYSFCSSLIIQFLTVILIHIYFSASF